FVTLGEALDHHGPRAFRLLVQQTHYRRQMELGEKELSDAEKAVDRIDSLVRQARRVGLEPAAFDAELTRPVYDAMNDDFDTPAAVATIFGLVKDANIALAEDRLADAAPLTSAALELWGILGLWLDDTDGRVGSGGVDGGGEGGGDAEIDALVVAR